jgi:hypothetical protein
MRLIITRMRAAALSGMLVLGAADVSAQEKPVASWSFEGVAAGAGTAAADAPDALQGHISAARGVSGDALKLDGYTTRLVRKANAAPAIGRALTVDAWVALAAYPWNWAAVVSHATEPYAGYYLGIGARGELTLRAMVDGRWRVVESADSAVPLRRWTHVAATYDAASGLTLYVDGREVARRAIDTSQFRGAGRRSRGLTGLIEPARTADLLIGMNAQPVRPSDWHRLEGTPPAWYSLDGLLDEVRIFDVALPAAAIASARAGVAPPDTPDLPARVMPSGPPGAGPFGAYYTRLAYYPQWDALWQVGPHPDVVVRFDGTPARLVFWRGTQYGPAWVTGNNIWMADQSVEGYDPDFTWEHMNDKQNLYSHVRVVEQTDARVVVHWRYAPVNVLDQLWNQDPKTGNGTWIDEYYYVYPDAKGVRKVTWQKGRLGTPVQFQESLPLAHAGQLQGEIVNPDFVTVGNLHGVRKSFRYTKEAPLGPEQAGTPEALTIQMHNLKSPQKPFIVFDEGNQMMYLRDLNIAALSRPPHHSHWPVAQIPSDGRSNQAPDGPGHLLGFPISRPPMREARDRQWWNGFYGMTEEPFESLVGVARSWANAPELRITGTTFSSRGFDRSERAYMLSRVSPGGGGPLRFEVAASPESPVRNLALVIENWGDAGAELTIDGKPVARGGTYRYGHRHTLTGSDLIVWIELARDRPVAVTLSPGR